jgi:hypothetical protein
MSLAVYCRRYLRMIGPLTLCHADCANQNLKIGLYRLVLRQAHLRYCCDWHPMMYRWSEALSYFYRTSLLGPQTCPPHQNWPQT